MSVFEASECLTGRLNDLSLGDVRSPMSVFEASECLTGRLNDLSSGDVRSPMSHIKGFRMPRLNNLLSPLCNSGYPKLRIYCMLRLASPGK
jgi:hypothetical protein